MTRSASRVPAIAALVVTLVPGFPCLAAQGLDCTPVWSSPFGEYPTPSSFSGIARDAVEFDDGSGAAPFFAGEFWAADSSLSIGVLRYDSLNGWSSVGNAGVNKPTNALLVFDDGSGPALYRGGEFPFGLERWGGGPAVTDWIELGDASQGGNVRAMIVHDDGSGPAIYVGGEFTTMGGIAAEGIARWDGAGWSALGSGIEGSIATMTVHDDGSGAKLYVGGNPKIGGTPGKLAVWDGSTWAHVPGGLNGQLLALAELPGVGGQPARLAAGGEFTTAAGMTVNYVASWDGTSWSALDNGFPKPVVALGTYDAGQGAELLASWGDDGGGRTERFDGASWQPLDPLDQHVARTIAAADLGDGPVALLGGSICGDFALWDGNSVRFEPAVTNGSISAEVHDLGNGPELFAFGSFTHLQGKPATHTARWDGAGWVGMPGFSIASNGPLDIETFDDGSGPTLYACTVAGVFEWDGSVWSQISDPGAVFELLTFDDGTGPALYACGSFQWPPGAPTALRVARYDGASWLPVGAGFSNGLARDMAVVDLGAGPVLAIGGSLPPGNNNKVFVWDGIAWTQLGSGQAGNLPTIADLVSFQGDVYVSNAGRSTLRWTGSLWEPVPGAPAESLGNMFVGSDGTGGTALFATQGAGVHRYDGTNWTFIAHPDGASVQRIGDSFGLGGSTSKLLVSGGVFVDTWGAPCDAPNIYCTPKISSAGCAAAIGTSDLTAQPKSGASDYSVIVSGVHGQKNGHVFVGLSGSLALPFLGGTLCVQPPTKRGPTLNSGGSGPASCDGSYTTVVNDGLVVPFGLDAGPGESAWYQMWYRDPQGGLGALGSAFSNAVQLHFN